MGNRGVSGREGTGVTVKGAIGNGKVIGSTEKVPLIIIRFGDGYLLMIN